MEDQDENSDVDDLFLPFALSRAIQNQGIQHSINPENIETSGEYVEIVLDEDSNSSYGETGSRFNDISLLDGRSDTGEPSSLCPSPAPLSPGNTSTDLQHDLAEFRRANPACRERGHLEKLDSFDSVDTERDNCEVRGRKDSILDGLLCEIYDRCHPSAKTCVDSDGFTECSSDGAYLSSKGDSFQESTRLPKALLNAKSTKELRDMVRELQHGTAVLSGRLIKQLKRRDRYLAKRQKNQDVLTALLQAVSQKRRVDAQLRFSIEPLPGKKAFRQWYDALRAVARLPFGLPHQLRRTVWLSLADKHIRHLKLDWEKTVRIAFNDHSNPDDDKLGVQIVKDLHRTGCSGFCGQGAEEDRVVLKRVLLAYARWNKSVGYCQGFNVIAALILEVMERMEDNALKVMIFLIDHVLPDSYFANNLRALSVDMAVFRELLHFKLPELAQHLDKLQKSANDGLSGSYEPPLTNVFTMQWFLTLFATCLPKQLVLRVWDTLFLEGSEVLLRVALAIWSKLAQPLLEIKSADEFYTQMAVLCNEMLQDQLLNGDELIQTIYSMAPFPFPHLNEIREKYMFSITPFSPLGALEKSSATEKKSPVAGSNANRKEASRGYSQPSTTHGNHSDEDAEFLDDADLTNMTCFTGLFPPASPYAVTDSGDRSEAQGIEANDITRVSPGAYSMSSEELTLQTGALMERMTMDIHSLKKQYLRIQRRQSRAHVIYGPGSAKDKRANKPAPEKKNIAAAIESPAMVNHLLVGKSGLGKKNAKFTATPQIAPPAKGFDEDTPTKRGHVNPRPNVKQSLQSQLESASSEQDLASEYSQTTLNDGESGGFGSEADLTERQRLDSSSSDDERACPDGESQGPVIGTLIDLDDDPDEEQGAEEKGHTSEDSCDHEKLPAVSDGTHPKGRRRANTSASSRDLNDNDVFSSSKRVQQATRDASGIRKRATSVDSIPKSTAAPDFNCSIKAFNPHLPRSSMSALSEPIKPSDKKPWMETNGSSSHESVSSGVVHHSYSSWMRRSSSGSSCDESSSPPPRVMFNPFPKRALKSSENRTRTRMKLGLYPGHMKDMQKEPMM